MLYVGHKKSREDSCPKCGGRIIVIFDDQHGKKIKKCSNCSYRKETILKSRKKTKPCCLVFFC